MRKQGLLIYRNGRFYKYIEVTPEGKLTEEYVSVGNDQVWFMYSAEDGVVTIPSIGVMIDEVQTP